MTEDNQSDSCEKCKFWLSDDYCIHTGVPVGYCRRNAPRPLSVIATDEPLYCLHPLTSPDDWCGEFEIGEQ